MIFLTGFGLLLVGLALALFFSAGFANAYQRFNAEGMFCAILLCLVGIVAMGYSLFTFAYHNLP